jgi:hypothetical protein
MTREMRCFGRSSWKRLKLLSTRLLIGFSGSMITELKRTYNNFDFRLGDLSVKNKWQKKLEKRRLGLRK